HDPAGGAGRGPLRPVQRPRLRRQGLIRHGSDAARPYRHPGPVTFGPAKFGPVNFGPGMRQGGLRLLATLAAVGLIAVAPADPLYRVAPGLFQAGKPDLGLKPAPGAQTFTVFAPGENTDRFSNGVVLTPFKWRLYAQWQSSARDEDAPDTWVAWSV